jgi:hypothetical protein
MPPSAIRDVRAAAKRVCFDDVNYGGDTSARTPTPRWVARDERPDFIDRVFSNAEVTVCEDGISRAGHKPSPPMSAT